MEGISNDLIAELLAKGRTRNQYGPKLLEFCESDEAAINPRDVWPIEFGNKNTSTMYQGFRKAMIDGKLEDILQISQLNDEMFILHKERVALVQAQLTTA
jgi:hypothetical protein